LAIDLTEAFDNGKRSSVVGVLTRLRTGLCGVRICEQQKRLFSKKVRTGSGVHSASYWMGNGVLSWE